MSSPSFKPLTFLITGTSSGFGTELTKYALSLGHRVIATSRNASYLAHLAALGATTISLDVNLPLPALSTHLTTTLSSHSPIDILINNAAFLCEGSLEESSPEESHSIFATNVLSPLNLIRTPPILPTMRSRKSGLIINIGSIGSWYASAGIGLYCASKMALAGLSLALAEEVAPFNIKVIHFEPGYFATALLAPGNKNGPANPIPEYDAVLNRGLYDSVNGNQPGDPVKGCKVIIDLAVERFHSGSEDNYKDGKKWPVRIPLGNDAPGAIGRICKEELEVLERFEERTVGTNRDGM